MDTSNIKEALTYEHIKELDERLGELEHTVDEWLKTTAYNYTWEHIADQLMSIRMTLRYGEL